MSVLMVAATVSLWLFATRAEFGGRETADAVQLRLQHEATLVLQEMVRGPLDGHRITLLMDVDVEDAISVDALLAALDSRAQIVRTGGQGLEVGFDGEATSDQDPFVTGTVVSLVNREVPWPLETPPATWVSSALVLMQLNLDDCRLSLLETRLAEQTPSLALLCPMFSRQEDSLLFRVLTHLPLDPDQRFVQQGLWQRGFSFFFYDRFRSFGGKTLHVASDDDDAPLVFLDDERQFEGTSKRILDVLSVWLNFTYTMTHGAPDSKWGEIENGTWVGLLGEVHQGRKDLAVNYFTITHQRSLDFDYSVSYHTEGFGFALPIPPEVPKWRNLIYPFTWVLWAAVGGLVLASSGTFYVFTHFAPLNQRGTRLSYALASILKALVNQSNVNLPRAWSLRLFLAAWWLTCYVIVISYTCNLIAMLTVPVFPSRIQTLRKLADSNFRLCMLDYGEFVPEALVSSPDSVMRSLGAKMDLVPVTDEGFYGQEDCGALVLDRENAHIETYAYLKITYSDMGLSDKVYFMREQIYEGNLAFFFRKRTPWRKAFDEGLLRLIEAGFVQHWHSSLMHRFQRPTPKASQEIEASSPRSLSLAHLQGAFFVLGFGLTTGLLVFILEYKFGDAAPASGANQLHPSLKIIFNP